MDLSDLFQNFQIREAKQTAGEAKYVSQDNSINIRELQNQVDHLSLVSMAMCELMAEIGFSKNMILKKIEEIDLRDGKLDGKVATKRNTCTGCGRSMAGRHRSCMYCGEPLKKQSVL